MLDMSFALGVCHWRGTPAEQRQLRVIMAGSEPMSEGERAFRAELVKTYDDAVASSLAITGPECDRLIAAANANLTAARRAA